MRESLLKIVKDSIDIQSVQLQQNGQSHLVFGGTNDLSGIGIKTDGVVNVPPWVPSSAIRDLDSTIPLAMIAGDMGDQISRGRSQLL